MSVSQPLTLTATTDLTKDSIVFLQVREGVARSINVRNLTGSASFFEIGPGETVIDLKLKISDREEIPPEEQCLVYSGAILKGTI